MANYNTFIVVDCKRRKNVLTTSSARKASKLLQTGFRIEVWNKNSLLETIYSSDAKRERGNPLEPYINLEKNYIAEKQKRAEARNKRRKGVKYDLQAEQRV